MNDDLLNDFNEINDLMGEYVNRHVVIPNEIKKYRNTISNVYKKYNIKTSSRKMFPDKSTFNNMPEQAQEEMIFILDAMQNNDNVLSYQTYKDILKEKKFQKWGVTRASEVIKRMDYLKSQKDSDVIQNVLSSDQIMDLYSIANKNNISESDLFDEIIDQYDATGTIGDSLHQNVYKAIIESGKAEKERIKEEKASKPVKFGNQSITSKEVKNDVNNIKLQRGSGLTGRRKSKKKR